MNITTGTRTRGMAALAAGLLVLAACGSDDDASTADTIVETTVTPETTEASETTEAVTTTDAPETTDAPATTEAEALETATIGEVASANGATFIPGYTAFAPNYDAAINGDGPVTALMPSDDGFIAFSTAYPDLTGQMRADFAALDDLLLYHTIDGALLVEAMVTGTDLISLQGEPITVEVTDGVVILNGGQATITIADLAASNGVVHILDGILLPPSLAATAS